MNTLNLLLEKETSNYGFYDTPENLKLFTTVFKQDARVVWEAPCIIYTDSEADEWKCARPSETFSWERETAAQWKAFVAACECLGEPQ